MKCVEYNSLSAGENKPQRELPLKTVRYELGGGDYIEVSGRGKRIGIRGSEAIVVRPMVANVVEIELRD